MKKENCKNNLTWDYKGWNKFVTDGENPYTQDDWNQTLLTMINRASINVHTSSLRAPADSIKVNLKTFCVITKLEYFNEFTFKISDRYNVIIDDTLLDDEIFVFNKYLLEENLFIPTYELGKVTIDSDGNKETKLIDVTFKEDFTPEELSEYKLKLCVYIQILNRNPTT